MLKTSTNYFVSETNSFLFLSAGKLSGRWQLMHFRKMLSAFSFSLFISVSQFFGGFKFNQQLNLSKLCLTLELEPSDWLKWYAVFTIFRTRGIVIKTAHEYSVTFQVNDFYYNDFFDNFK